jgi:Asp-tRNA(Asn)/Glu-tRNA(Gln) amidotransferase A subunit family amidase
MNLDEYGRLDALGLADLIRRGEVTAAELLELAQSAITQANPSLNFLVEPIGA